MTFFKKSHMHTGMLIQLFHKKKKKRLHKQQSINNIYIYVVL
jgi:hypothetical protein